MTAFVWNAQRVSEALGLPPPTWERTYTGLSTDTRSLKEGELFVALKGERFDGRDFLGDARLAGVGGVVVRAGTPRWPGFDWFEVDDTLAALGRLAQFRRTAFAGPVVAVTGTNGKTGTKELIAAALGVRFRVHRSARNFNNLVGVPLAVLAAPEDAEVMVIECGMSVPGEIARQRDIVRPSVAVITNVGAGHLEGVGGLEQVMIEKTSLLEGAARAIVGIAPRELPERSAQLVPQLVTAGLEAPADWLPEEATLGPDGRPSFRVRGVTVELPLHGRHHMANALIALAVADALGAPLADAAAALSTVTIPGGRSQVVEVEGITVIHDCYNANPASLQAALELLAGIRSGRRTIVVVGTMRELGAASAELHREAAAAILAAKPDVVAAVGEFVPVFGELERGPKGGVPDRAPSSERPPEPGPRFLYAETPDAVAPRLKELLRPGDVVLFKASRGVALERVYPLLWPSHPFGEVH